MKKIFYSLTVVLCLSFTGCNDDDSDCYPPVYHGFTYQPNIVYAGDSVTITAVQQRKGNHLNATDYIWKLTLQIEDNENTRDTTLAYNQHTNYGGISNADPEWKLKIPNNTIAGTYSCRFEAQWSNSSDGVGGVFRGGTGEGCYGTITSSSGVLYSQASGSFSLPINRRQ